MRRGDTELTIDERVLSDAIKGRVQAFSHNTHPRVVAFIPLSNAVDPKLIKSRLISLSGEEESKEELKAYPVDNAGSSINKKERLIYKVCSRDSYETLDVCKTADVVVFVMSCKNAQLDKLKDDPDIYANAIDEEGYHILSLLRVQGLPPSVGVLQHLEEIPKKKQNEVRKLFNRYFVSELSEKDKFHALSAEDNSQVKSEYKLFLRSIAVAFPKQQFFWKDNRSYMIT